MQVLKSKAQLNNTNKSENLEVFFKNISFNQQSNKQNFKSKIIKYLRAWESTRKLETEKDSDQEQESIW